MRRCETCGKELSSRQDRFCCRKCVRFPSKYGSHEERLDARRKAWRHSKQRGSGKPVPVQIAVDKTSDERETAKEWAFRVWSEMSVSDRRIVTVALANLDVQPERKAA